MAFSKVYHYHARPKCMKCTGYTYVSKIHFIKHTVKSVTEKNEAKVWLKKSNQFRIHWVLLSS